ncbi:MAG TPA: DUF4062 domain-containing protein [Panacibacter sp.]|nr:DUF4062 domain-containing protein [Panacibacter sp.]HNP45068.1 DUF4062 domain-containing protein [Panacibacter sp.]
MAYKAFVASTLEDLREHRKFVIHALRISGIFVDPFEDWSAAGDEPTQFSPDRLNGCDLCILLVGYRRGYVPYGDILSITQVEYETAKLGGIDTLVFLLRDGVNLPAKYNDLEKDHDLLHWRAELAATKAVGYFDTYPASINIVPELTRWLMAKQQNADRARTRHERVIVLSWLNQLPDKFDTLFKELFESADDKGHFSKQGKAMSDKNQNDLFNSYYKLRRELPIKHATLNADIIEQRQFDEVFAAFQREAINCFDAYRAMLVAANVPEPNSTAAPVTREFVYNNLEVNIHLGIFRTAVEELIKLFPADEVNDALST